MHPPTTKFFLHGQVFHFRPALTICFGARTFRTPTSKSKFSILTKILNFDLKNIWVVGFGAHPNFFRKHPYGLFSSTIMSISYLRFKNIPILNALLSQNWTAVKPTNEIFVCFCLEKLICGFAPFTSFQTSGMSLILEKALLEHIKIQKYLKNV